MDAVTIASISMQSDLQRLDQISQNLANVATNGYKRQYVLGRSFASYLPSDLADGPAASDVPAALDMRPGSLRATANPMDIAVEGEGFFEVASEQGVAYARQATLRVDARGRLVTLQDLPLAGLRADVRPNAGEISINPQGEVMQGERVLGQIKLVRFEQTNLMQALGHGLFAQGGASLAGTQSGASAGSVGNLRSGFQETSNVNSAQEMVSLTQTVRHFETMQKVMQGYGDVFEQTLRKLGEF